MKRKLFPLAAAMSLALCVGTVAWWVAGDSRVRHVSFQTPSHTLRVSGHQGQLLISRSNGSLSGGDAGAIHWSASPAGKEDKTPGLRLMAAGFSSDGKESAVTLPPWLLVLTFLVLPGLWVWSKCGKPKKKPAKD